MVAGSNNTDTGGYGATFGAHNTVSGGNAADHRRLSEHGLGELRAVSGGQYDEAKDAYSSITGGCSNLTGKGYPSGGSYAGSGAETITGGFDNVARGNYGVVAGGQYDDAAERLQLREWRVRQLGRHRRHFRGLPARAPAQNRSAAATTTPPAGPRRRWTAMTTRPPKARTQSTASDQDTALGNAHRWAADIWTSPPGPSPRSRAARATRPSGSWLGPGRRRQQGQRRLTARSPAGEGNVLGTTITRSSAAGCENLRRQPGAAQRQWLSDRPEAILGGDAAGSDGDQQPPTRPDPDTQGNAAAGRRKWHNAQEPEPSRPAHRPAQRLRTSCRSPLPIMNPWLSPLKQSTVLGREWQVTPSWFHRRPRPSRGPAAGHHECWLIGTSCGRPSTLIWTNGSPTGPKLGGGEARAPRTARWWRGCWARGSRCRR